jgi:hypothetical protein
MPRSSGAVTNPPERDSVGILGLYGADRVGVLNVDAVRAKGEVLHPPPAGVVRCDGDGAVEQLVEHQLRLLALTDQGRRRGQHGETRATCRPKLPSTLLRSAMGGQPGFLKAQSLIRGGVPDLPQQDPRPVRGPTQRVESVHFAGKDAGGRALGRRGCPSS